MFRLAAAVALWFLALDNALAAPTAEPPVMSIDETDLEGEMQMLSGRLVEENKNLVFYEKILRRVLARKDTPDEHEITLLQDQINTAKYNVMSLEKTIEVVRQKWFNGGVDFVDYAAGADKRHHERHQDHHEHHEHHEHHHDPHQHHEHHHFQEQRMAN